MNKIIIVIMYPNLNNKLGCVVRMVVDSILPHADSEPNDHRKDAPPFITQPTRVGTTKLTVLNQRPTSLDRKSQYYKNQDFTFCQKL